MEHTTDVGFKPALNGNFSEAAILAHGGIRGDADELIMLDPSISQQFASFDEKINILYQFGKIKGKFASWQNCLVDLNFNQTGKIMLLRQWSDPIPWNGITVYCSPNKSIEM